MNSKRNRWIIAGVLLLITLLVSGFVLMRPSAKEILVEAMESVKTVESGHAVVSIDLDSIEESTSGTVEVWAQMGQEGPGAFRLEVLETSKPEARGAVVVSDGDILWAYSPAENKLFTGTLEEARELMKKNGEFSGRVMNKQRDELEAAGAGGDVDHPETPEEAVDKLAEYFRLSRSGAATNAGEGADHIRMEPIPEQMPEEYAAVGGLINVWFSQVSGLPVAMDYSGGALGEAHIAVIEYEVNTELDPALFSFDIPVGVEIVNIKDLEPEALTLEEAERASAGEFLTPGTTPDGAALVEIIEVRGAIVQRYALPDGGSFTIAQGEFEKISESIKEPSPESTSVTVRGLEATLFEADEKDQVLLTWQDGQLLYVIGGELNAAEAIAIAESLE